MYLSQISFDLPGLSRLRSWEVGKQPMNIYIHSQMAKSLSNQWETHAQRGHGDALGSWSVGHGARSMQHVACGTCKMRYVLDLLRVANGNSCQGLSERKKASLSKTYVGINKSRPRSNVFIKWRSAARGFGTLLIQLIQLPNVRHPWERFRQIKRI